MLLSLHIDKFFFVKYQDDYKTSFSLLQNKDKCIIIRGKSDSAIGTLVKDETYRIQRITVKSKDWYSMGYLEGYGTAESTYEYMLWLKQYKIKTYTFLGIKNDPIKVIYQWIDKYMEEQKSSMNEETLQQLNGLVDGYNSAVIDIISEYNLKKGKSQDQAPNLKHLTFNDFVFMNMFHEMDDIVLAGKPSIYKDQDPKNLMKRMLVTGRSMVSILHSYLRVLSTKTYWSFFQWIPYPPQFRVYKWYSIENDKGVELKRFNFVSNPGQIISTESVSVFKHFSVVTSSQPVIHFHSHPSKQRIHFLDMSNAHKSSLDANELVNQLSNIQGISMKLLTYPLNNIYTMNIGSVIELYNGETYMYVPMVNRKHPFSYWSIITFYLLRFSVC